MGQSASGAGRPGDAEITDWVEEAIAADPRVSGCVIEVETREDIVTLSGAVDRWAERRAAGHVAATTRGGRKVSNRSVVQPYPYPWRESQPDVDPGGPPEWDPCYFDHMTLPWIASADTWPGRSTRRRGYGDGTSFACGSSCTCGLSS